MRSLPILTAVTAASLIAPGAALASTVSLEGSTAVFRSGSHASDAVLDTRVFGAVGFTDARQRLVAGAGCVAGTPVICPTAFDSSFILGAGSDRIRAWSGSGFTLSVSGAGGDDDIEASGNFTHVDAGSGNDRVVAGSNGTAEVIGGDGDDRIRSRFTHASDFEGDGGNDLIVVDSPERNTISGGGGNDDIFVLGSGSTGGGYGTITSGAGDDAIIVRSRGGIGYQIDSGADIDTIYGGNGADDIKAGGGDDLIDVYGDHAATPGSSIDDVVNCGPGADTVFADPSDVIAANCEWVEYGPIPRPWEADRALEHLATGFPEVTPPVL
jgi:hypothetical protein